jgi:hypothetical protein
MHPLLGQELAAAKMGDMQRRLVHSTAIKRVRGEKQRAAKPIPASQGRFIPAGALRLGRAVLRLRSKPAQPVSC